MNSVLTIILTIVAVTVASAAITPVPEKAPCAVPDRQDFQNPDRVILSGFVGRRIAGNELARLVRIDPNRLLEGYRTRPGRQSWDGEHVANGCMPPRWRG